MIPTRKKGVSQYSYLYRIPQGMMAIAVILSGTNSLSLAAPRKQKLATHLINVTLSEAAGLARSAQPLLAQRSLPPTPAISTPATPAVPASPPAAQPTPSTPLPPPGSSVSPSQSAPGASPSQPGVMVPNPQITIQESQPAIVNPALTPTLPRAIAPPVGDMSVTSTDPSADVVNLGSNARIDRLVLRDTPARDILATLVRAAGLNFAYTGDPSGGNLPPGQLVVPGGTGGQAYAGPLITIDLGNESIQTAFNTILRLSNFDANRVGDTILVGPKLPNGARGLTSRSIRLNQVTVGAALNFLVAMGAESAISRERTVTTVNAVPVGANLGGEGNFGAATNNPGVATQTQTSTESRVEVQRVAFQDGQPLLRGLQVVGDERTNTITLMGSNQHVQIATSHLVQLDSRRRQAIINVRIIDVNLTALKDVSSSFSFGVNDTLTVVDQGLAAINFGTSRPPSVQPSAGIRGGGGITTSEVDSAVPFSNRFLARLNTSVTQGSAKILTDPTLTVQEGQTAQINLTQEVFGGLRIQQSATGAGGSSTLTTQEPIIKQAGLTLSIKIDRVDDNGFISLSVAPTVSAPNGVIDAGDNGTITLLAQRTLSSGQIRLRDGQTLVLAGIIQENDRADVTKVPILGDIPLLGTLFRKTGKNNQRQEVIVLLTPQIMDDSDRANFGFGYTPSPEADKLLRRDRQLNPSRQKR
jgi:type IV pilus assembly protein PilQ